MRAVEVAVRVCANEDIDRLRSSGHDPRAVRRHEERFLLQQAGQGWHLLAWADDRLVGQATVTVESRYEVVRDRLGVFPEVNALAASPQGQGIGTTVLAAAECLVDSAPMIGLAVETSNPRARALYERLGYTDWGNGAVVDVWAERDAEGTVVAVHHDECDYLVKRIIRARGA